MFSRRWRRKPQTNQTQPERGEPVAATQERTGGAPGPRPAEGPPGAPFGEGGAGAAVAAPTRRRRGVGWHGRNAGAATIGAFGSGVLTLASVVLLAAVLIALLIGLAIVLFDVDANASNTIVKGIHEGANFFASPFTGLIKFSGHPKRAISVDWGIALLVYLIVGLIISRWIARLGRGGVRFERAHRPAV
jgi:hypothetical protein